MFSGKVIKYNRFGMKQDRTILLTNLNLYNIKKKGKVTKIIPIAFQRKIPIQKLKGATMSTIAGNYEFVVHVKTEYDYRFVCE